jgi:hypothetical protein
LIKFYRAYYGTKDDAKPKLAWKARQYNLIIKGKIQKIGVERQYLTVPENHLD